MVGYLERQDLQRLGMPPGLEVKRLPSYEDPAPNAQFLLSPNPNFALLTRAR